MSESRAERSRLPRGSLTKRTIAETSLRLLDEHGVAAFSMARLGRALGADQTAVYRHFSDKDDLILAIADLLLEEVLVGFVPVSCWWQTVADFSRRMRSVYKLHPAAGSLAAIRITRGPNEMRLVDALLAATLSAGFEGREAALYYRVVADFAMYWAGSHATYLSLDSEHQMSDEASWTREYAIVDPVAYPNTAIVRQDLGEVGFDEIFETALELLLSGIADRAPNPCRCDEGHGPAASPDDACARRSRH
jgi:AcrR family transcriptional regulator